MEKREVAIPSLMDVAEALGIECPPTNGGALGPASLSTPEGFLIRIKFEGGTWRSSQKTAIVLQTSNYGREKVLRKVYVQTGYFDYRSDKQVRRKLTDDEVAKLKEKYAEVAKAQKEVDEVDRRRQESHQELMMSSQAIENALSEADIEPSGIKGDIRVDVYKKTMSISLRDKSPQQIVNIYKAVEKVLKAVS